MPPSANFDLLLSIAGLGAIAAMAGVRGVWALQVIELLLLLTVPGFVLVRAAAVPPSAVVRFPLYVLCGSLAVIMAAGLAIDLIGPLLGISRPLTRVPLLVSLCVVCAVLIVIAVRRNAPSLLAQIGPGARIWCLWPLALPVVAWVGVMRLNNGHGRGVAVAAVAASGIALLLGAWRAGRWPLRWSALLIYAASLALMLGFSLRGHFVYGFDINGEYRTLVSALAPARWHAAHPGDAYGAMLSLTILPSTLVALTGASPLLVLRVVFPVLFAFFPVGVLLLGARVLDRRLAYLGVLFIVVQDYLFQQLPAVARQEIALVFFVVLLFALLDVELQKGTRTTLTVLFGAGLALSHYGTTYLTVTLFFIALVLELLRRLCARRMGWLAQTERVGLRPFAIALLVTAGVSALWYVPITQSEQNVSSFFTDLSTNGLSLLPSAGHRGLVQSYVSGNVASRVSGDAIARQAEQDYRKNHRYDYIHPLPDAKLPQYRLQSVSVPTPRAKSPPLLSALDAVRTVTTQLVVLIAAVGAALLWLRRRAEEPLRAVALLAASTLGVLAFIRFSGTAANDYNQSRAFLQAMVPLCLCLAWVLQLASARRRWRVAPVAFAAALALVLLNTSGLRGPLLGGDTPGNLASSGEDYERFVVSGGDVAAASWLQTVLPPQDVVTADRYAQLRIRGLTGHVPTFGVLTPTTLDPNSWIYADKANFVGNRTRAEEGDQYSVYGWPVFVKRLWNLVYTNGSAGVYARTHPAR